MSLHPSFGNDQPVVPLEVMKAMGATAGIGFACFAIASIRDRLTQSLLITGFIGFLLVLSLMVFLSGITAEQSEKKRIQMAVSFFFGFLLGFLFPPAFQWLLELIR